MLICYKHVPLGLLRSCVFNQHLILRTITVRAARTKQDETEYTGANKSLIAPLPERLLRKHNTAMSVELKQATSDIQRFTKARKFDEAWSVYKQTLNPDAAIHCAALNVCAKAFWHDRALQIWDKLPEEDRSVVSYTAMIDMHGRHKQVDEAERLFREMTSLGINPNVITHIAMISAYSMAGHGGHGSGRMENALIHFKAMQTTMLPQSSVQTQQAAYTAIMGACARDGNYTKAHELFQQMLEAGIPPTHMHYNTLMTACASQGYSETAQQVFDMMCTQKLLPRVEDYTILMSCWKHDLARCQQLMADLRSANLQPLRRTCQELLEAHVLARDGPGGRVLVRDAGAHLDSGSRKVLRLLGELDRLQD
eukprot:TRINITY_DN45645_c0_g1_i1.p1 TRINITY_DN45645_c0_g1~~TRINITY_DN45645_c0_g1_i1.p1  ORF type:complete len:367 (+),score=58.74 TRINITY_DN45645_c0_g1_i1:56-1156(+)